MKVSLGVVHGDKVDGWFLHMMIGMLTSRHNEHPLDDHVFVRSGPLLSMGRGQCAGSFVTNGDADALLMLDSDQYATPDVVYAHIDAFARIREQDPTVGVLAGITFISKDPKGDVIYPNLWGFDQKHPMSTRQLQLYPKDSLIEIAAAGCSNMLIAREVLEHFANENVNPFHHVNIVDYGAFASTVAGLDDTDKIEAVTRATFEDADQFGEDLSFCYRVREAGFKIYCHTGAIYQHSKHILLGEQEYDAAVARHRKEPAAP